MTGAFAALVLLMSLGLWMIRRVAVGGCVRAWWEDDSDRSASSLRWFGLSSAPCCRGSSFEMRLQGTRSFPRRTPNVLAGLIWLPTGFYKFSQFFDSCLTFPAPKHRQWNMETLKHFGHLKRHEETIWRIWQKLLTWNQQRGKTELWNTFSDGNTDVWGPKQIKKYTAATPTLPTGSNGTDERSKNRLRRHLRKHQNLMIGTFVGCRWGLSNTAGTVSFIKDIFECDCQVFIYVFKPKGWRT